MELRLLEAILEKYSREISNAFSEEETDESRTYVLRNFVGRATEILSECKNWTGRSITLSVYRACDCTSPEADAFSKERVCIR